MMLRYTQKPPALAGVVLFILACGTSPAMTQGTQTTQRNPPAAQPAAPAWALSCSSANAGSGALECQMSQTILRQETGQTLMVITIRKPESGSMTMNLVLPHGLYLPAGVSYQVGTGAKQKATIYSSNQNGAYATVPLAPELLNTLKAGSVLNIGLETVSRNPLNVPVSLTGFKSAVDRLANLK